MKFSRKMCHVIKLEVAKKAGLYTLFLFLENTVSKKPKGRESNWPIPSLFKVKDKDFLRLLLAR